MKFIKYYQWVARSELSTMDKLVYCALLSYQGDKLECWPGQDTLAGDLGTSSRTIKRAIKNLDQAKWISIKVFGHGKTNRYSCLRAEESEDKSVTHEVPTCHPRSANLSLHEVTTCHPLEDNLSLLSSRRGKNQPTRPPIRLPEKEKKGGGGGFSLKEEIEKISNYEFSETDWGVSKMIEKNYQLEQVAPMLHEVVADWIAEEGTNNAIQSIPRVLRFRLIDVYGK